MHVEIDIEFEQLIKIVKALPANQLTKLKAELNKGKKPEADPSENLEDFLLKGPTFSQKQLDKIAETRKAIDEWRAK